MQEKAVHRMNTALLLNKLMEERDLVTPIGTQGISIKTGVGDVVAIPTDHHLYDQLKDAIYNVYSDKIEELEKRLLE